MFCQGWGARRMTSSSAAPSSWLTLMKLPFQNAAQLLNTHGSDFAFSSESTNSNAAGMPCSAQYSRSFSTRCGMNGH